ncbi:MAG: Lrp/AsnC ligand binding domain-containing protein, partial [Deltaproteobacteria bacterium]|nr:Lrp/AsnC ligand binding domain-containing protein [Deltaproteobacteria bacterium]
MITGFVLIKVEKGRVQEIASRLGESEEVKEVFSVTGSYDLVAKVQVKEYENMSDIVTDQFQRIDGLVSTQTVMAFKTYKVMDLSESVAPPVQAGLPQETAGLAEEGKTIVKSILSKLTQGIDLSSNEIFSFIGAIDKDLLTSGKSPGISVTSVNH